jgi:hypothetical protein
MMVLRKEDRVSLPTDDCSMTFVGVFIDQRQIKFVTKN